MEMLGCICIITSNSFLVSHENRSTHSGAEQFQAQYVCPAEPNPCNSKADASETGYCDSLSYSQTPSKISEALCLTLIISMILAGERSSQHSRPRPLSMRRMIVQRRRHGNMYHPVPAVPYRPLAVVSLVRDPAVRAPHAPPTPPRERVSAHLALIRRR